MDLTTHYLGLKLDSPFVVGASPLSDDLDAARRLEDAGASCIVLRSLFEEQITREKFGTVYSFEVGDPADAEVISSFPRANEFALDPDEYLELIRRLKESLRIPVIGSLNGVYPGRWLEYGGLIESAGADALELNVFFVATDPKQPAAALEARTAEMARVLKLDLAIPLALKLSPFFTSLPNLARSLESAGVAGLVLFNRFYERQARNVVAALDSGSLSQPSELLLRLRWLEVLSRTIRKADLAVSGGVHSGTDALQAILAGASAVQVVSSLLLHGVRHLQVMRNTMERWLAQHRYQSLEELRAATCFEPSRDPQVLSRASYMRILQSWQG